MHTWLDELLVACALLASVLYALNSLGPKSVKRGLKLWTAAVLRKLRAPGLRSLADRLQSAAAEKAAGCGGCGDCGPGAAETRPTGAADPEVRIPVSKIGKR